MAKTKCDKGVRRGRTSWIAGFITVLGIAGFGSAPAADSDSVNDSAKKVGNNFGELLKGMGQELKKAGGSLTSGTKKDKNKEKQQSDKEPDKGEEKSD